MKTQLFIADSVLVFSLSAPLPAAQLVDYDFDDSTPSASAVAAHLTASGITGGSGISVFAYKPGNPDTGLALSATKWTTSATYDPNDYFEVTLTPATGYQLTLSNFQVDARRSDTGPQTWELRSSVDGFGTVLGSETLPISSDFYPAQQLSIPKAYANLDSAVTFRMYGYGASGTLGTGTLRIDNLIIDGEITPVPEPAGWFVLAGLVLLGSPAAVRVFRRT